MTRLLFDITALQHANKAAIHGGREHCEALLFAMVSACENVGVTTYHYAGSALPEPVKQLLQQHSLRCLAAEDTDDLRRQLGTECFDIHYTCMPRATRLDMRASISAKRHVCTLFGFRGIEMPTDLWERYYCISLRERLKWLCKYSMKRIYTRRLVCQWRRFFASNRFDLWITNSEHSKYSLLSFAGDLVASESVHTLFPPPKLATEAEAVDWRSADLSPSGYFLVLMGNRWIKNAARAVRALDELYTARKGIPIKTLVLGVDDTWTSRLCVRNKAMFVLRPYVSHGQLQTLYANAFALIYPTLNEGFGYPPLDAMQSGVPVLASAIASVPEVCGDAPLYFNPFSCHEIKCRVLELLDSDKSRADCIRKGHDRFRTIAAMQRESISEHLALLASEGRPHV